MEESWLLEKLIAHIKYDYFLPKCKLEVVIDEFLGIFIEEVMNYYFNPENSDSEKVRLVSKEFPFRKKSFFPEIDTNGENESVNPDFLFTTRDTLYIVELKTASDSFENKKGKENEKSQLEYYLKCKGLIESKEKSPEFLYKDFENIVNKTQNRRHKRKYEIIAQSIKNTFKNVSKVEIIYVVPSALGDKIISKLQGVVTCISLSDLSEISLERQLDAKGSKAWDEIKDLFDYIDEQDRKLQGTDPIFWM